MKAKEIFKRIYVWVAENRIKIAILVALILIGLLLIPCISEFFFGVEVGENGKKIPIAPEKIITYVGAAFGGTILLFQLMENSKRNRNMEISNQNIVKTNEIAERGQINTRFKDAAMLLGSNDTASILSGIYALHQIAMECHKGKEEQKGYVKVIHDILCAYIRESAETKTNDKGEEERICTHPTVVMQTLVDVLFKNKGDIYGDYFSDLGGAVFIDVSFEFTSLRNVWFNNAALTKIRFCVYNIILHNVWFVKATLMDVDFGEATLSVVIFHEATLTDVGFEKATLTCVNFDNAILTNVSFFMAKLTTISFKDMFDEKPATLTNVDFTGTKLADYSYEEIIENSYELTK